MSVETGEYKGHAMCICKIGNDNRGASFGISKAKVAMELRFIRQDRMSIRTVAFGNDFALLRILINDDFATLPADVRKDYSIRKQILWESPDCSEAELSAMEVKFTRELDANNPDVGYNRWPKYTPK